MSDHIAGNSSHKSDFLPMTPGLLISMCIRADHGWGMPNPFSMLTLEEAQIQRLDEMAEDYLNGNIFINNAQLTEEATGKGFYSSDREDWYIAYCASEQVRVLAETLSEMINGQLKHDEPRAD